MAVSESKKVGGRREQSRRNQRRERTALDFVWVLPEILCAYAEQFKDDANGRFAVGMVRGDHTQVASQQNREPRKFEMELPKRF